MNGRAAEAEFALKSAGGGLRAAGTAACGGGVGKIAAGALRGAAMRMGVVLAALLALLVSGCNAPVTGGTTTALEAGNLLEVTSDMAMKIAGDPQVREAIAKKGTLKVVVEPVENDLRAEVLPAGPADAFTARVRALLQQSDPNSFTWIMNKRAFERLRSSEREMDLGPAPESVQPEYALTAKFYSLTDEDAEHRSTSYLCVYELTNIVDRTLLWMGKYELTKTAVKGFLD